MPQAEFFIAWPNKTLSPNARVHWSKLASAKKKAKQEAYYSALEAGLSRIDAERLNARFVLYPPDKRNRDTDNAIASLKAAIDGISLAVGIDDGKWGMSFTWAGETRQHGMVKVVLEWEAKEAAA